MSGIAGIIRFDGTPADRALVETMTATMPWRGPDGDHYWARGPVALGHCMLCTTTESVSERQPLANEDESVVLVMDGRVDNPSELRDGLLDRSVNLRDDSDAELVLRSYQAWGGGCLSHIDGDFAMVVWNARTRTAFCARDRSGNRPFNWHWDGKTLAFASELRAILALPWVRREFNEDMLAEYLGNEWHSKEETFWKGVMRLPGAHRMEVGTAGPNTQRYWQPDLFATLPCTSEDEYVEQYSALFTGVVRRISRSHKPVACEVSGGLDSSAIFATAAALRRHGELPAPAIEGYTLDFSGDPDADEMAYARAVGEHLGVSIREIPPSHRPLEWYRQWAREYGEFPGYPNGTMALGLREAAKADGCRVLLAGEGGDEWLGLGRPGYYYAEEAVGGNWRTLMACAREDFRTLGALPAARWIVRSGVAPLLPDATKRLARRLEQRLFTGPGARIAVMSHRRDWLTPRLRAVLDGRRAGHLESAPPRVHHRSQHAQLMAFHDAYAALARESEERSATRQGLELRLPYCHPEIIQFAFSTPERIRSLGRSTKRFHRRAMVGLLPDPVRQRSTKADFMTTFRRQLDECGPELTALIARRREWTDPKLASAFCAHRRDPALAGWVEWSLWTLAGCDALVS